MKLPLYLIDAFTDGAFGGNPAAVVLLPEPADAAWMQSLAAEMNLSETAFVVPEASGDFGLRWFTPAAEVTLCGHATLASAHALWSTGKLGTDRVVRFSTLSGILECTRDGEDISMSFPIRPPEMLPKETWPEGLVEALGINAVAVGQNGMDHLVRLDSEQDVRGAIVDFVQLAKVETRGVIITAPAKGKSDFVSRFFAPRVGVNEDPVTGSAHCCLAPYWGWELKKDVLLGYQASARGGYVKMKLEDGRVHLGGRAVTIVQGELAPAALPPRAVSH